MLRPYLICEFSFLFLALPLALRFVPWKIPPLPALWVASGCCLLILLRDPTFVRTQLWNPASLAANLPGILSIFAIGAALIGATVYFRAPQLLFNFVRTKPLFWALVMLLYPVLSVYPQGIIYRAFVMYRYGPLFHSPAAVILASAVAFSLMHILLRNPVAVPLTFIGGMLFAWRYQQTGSLFVSSFEHALYGCFIFTIGLGRYFYTRSI